jgi:predicted DNA-binding mobile mystery protein A
MAERMQQLRLRQLDEALRPWKSLQPPPVEGWIRTLRKALDMTLSDLGLRVGLSGPAISQFEKAETADSVTLSTLRKVAHALDCDLVYALVPRDSLRDFLEQEAREHARRRFDRVQHSMSLEEQAISREALENQVRDYTAELLAGDWRRIWKPL